MTPVEMLGFFIYILLVNDKLHPKRLVMFMGEIYKQYPALEKHPDYRFFYFYTDYPESSEYLFVVISDYLSNSPLAEKLNVSLNLYKDMFGFTESTIISEDDFNTQINKQLKKLQDQIRGSKFTSIYYEVW